MINSNTVASTFSVFKELWDMVDKKKAHNLVVKYTILVLLALPVETIILPYYLISKISSLSSSELSPKVLQRLVVTFVLTFAILKVISFFRYRIATKLQNQMYTDVKKTIMFDIMTLYKNVQKELPLGKLLNHMDNVPHIVEYIINIGIGYLLPEMVCLFTIVCFLFYIDVSLGIIVSIFITGYVWWILYKIDKSQIAAKKEATFRANHNQGVLNTLDNMLYILISNSFGFEGENFDKNNTEHLNKLDACEEANSNMFKILDTSSIVFLGVISYRLYILILNNHKGKLNFVKYTSVFIILVFFMDRLHDFKRMFTDVCTHLHKSRVFIEDIKEMRKSSPSPSAEVEEENILVPQIKYKIKRDYSIVLKNLNYQYPNTNFRVLDNKSLYFHRNKITAIQGSSGCGKTTLAKIILGLLNPHSGKIIIDNEDLTHQFSLRQHKVGFVPQQVKLFEGTILDNIRYTCHKKFTEKQVRQWVDKQGVSNILKRGPSDNEYLNRDVGISGSELSGGQRQIIIILRTFLANYCSNMRKSIYILDEPTSALDPKTTNAVLTLLRKYSSKFTIIVITHDQRVALKCDRAIHLKTSNS